MTSILRAEHISKRYILPSGETTSILVDVNFSIGSERLISITGKSGSGKSTLLNIFGTLDRPDSGSLYVQDKPIFDNGTLTLSLDALSSFRNKCVGFVFQQNNLLSDFTARENVAFPLFITSLSRKEIYSKADYLLELVGLSHRHQHYPHALSGGERQRVAVCRALISNPLLVLADEPSGSLDNESSNKLFDLLSSISHHFHTAFVIVTHNESYAQYSEAHYHLDKGTLARIK